MALGIRQTIKLSQQLLMTPQLQQAIKLLQLSRIELEQFVVQQLNENPILEEVADSRESVEGETTERTSDDIMREQLGSVDGIVDKISTDKREEIDWESMSRVHEAASPSAASTRKNNSSEEQPNYENLTSLAVSLSEHLATQVAESDLDTAERKIASALIGNLTDKGYLDLDLSHYCLENSLDINFVEGVLDVLQRMQPSGVAARNLQECLMIQIRERGLKTKVLERIVLDHMKELETRNYGVIAKVMKISVEEVIENAKIISSLDPVPARDFGGDPVFHVVPDVYVFKHAGEWIVSLNDEGLPNLKINQFYSDMAKSQSKGDDKDYVQDKLKSAQWLIKSIQQRQKTIFRVTECIVERQRDFLEKGIEYLKPLVLRNIAEDIEMHESTISRVTTSKYVHTPRGIFELKYFFNSSVSGSDGCDVASETVKTLIKSLVEGESTKKPYSDQKIVSLLEEKGVKLARRTVAKYRDQLGILPSSKRKKFY